MSRFRTLVENLLSEFSLEESFVSSNASAGKLTNRLYTSLTNKPLKDGRGNIISTSAPLEIKLASVGYDRYKKDEIVSYYVFITATRRYDVRGVVFEIPITIKCRCSTHDKPEQETNPPRDIDVFVPDSSFSKPFRRGDVACYDLKDEGKLDEYIDKARSALANKLMEKLNYLGQAIIEIRHDDQMYKDLMMSDCLSVSLLDKYPFLYRGNMYAQKYFQKWLNASRDKFDKEKPHN